MPTAIAAEVSHLWTLVAVIVPVTIVALAVLWIAYFALRGGK